MKRSSRQASQALFSMAIEQGGYFTAKQAREAGYDYPHLDYHVSCGNFLRAGHGLYRLPNLPAAEHDDLIRLSLWSRNRLDQPQAVVSHESALVLHSLSELLPTSIHLTVPPTFRKKPPTGCVLHKALLTPVEIQEHQGFRIIPPLRTILEVADGGISQEQLDKAVKDALQQGLIQKSKLLRAVKEQSHLRLLAWLLPEEAGSSTTPASTAHDTGA